MSTNRQLLISQVQSMLAPTPQDPLPTEWAVIHAALMALPGSADDQYIALDNESGQLPEWLTALQGTTVAQWDGSTPGSWGYGNIDRLAVSELAGLSVSLGGSPLNSASTFYVFPAKLGWVLGL
jgi:hypothetical protein